MSNITDIWKIVTGGSIPLILFKIIFFGLAIIAFEYHFGFFQIWKLEYLVNLEQNLTHLKKEDIISFENQIFETIKQIETRNLSNLQPSWSLDYALFSTDSIFNFLKGASLFWAFLPLLIFSKEETKEAFIGLFSVGFVSGFIGIFLNNVSYFIYPLGGWFLILVLIIYISTKSNANQS